MSQNDKAVITAAVGYVFTAEPGTPRPTPAQIASIDAEAFGCASYEVKAASAVPFTLTVGSTAAAQGPQEAELPADTSVDAGAIAPKASSKTSRAAGDAKAAESTPELPADSGAAEVQAALEALASVGAGNVKVTGESVTGGFQVAFIGKLHGQAVELAATGATATVSGAPNGWATLGHTSRGDLPEFGFDGGDTEVRGTWQNESLREVVTKPIADYLTLFLQQFDTQAFELYYGKDASKASGVFGVAGGTPVPVEKALLIIIVDGDTKIGFYSPKASVRRDDSISLATDEFASLPVRATFLKHGSSNKFEWINEDLFS